MRLHQPLRRLGSLSQKTILPRLQIHDYMSIPHYDKSDHPVIEDSQLIKDTDGTPKTYRNLNLFTMIAQILTMQ